MKLDEYLGNDMKLDEYLGNDMKQYSTVCG
jgi:hypothetical protein